MPYTLELDDNEQAILWNGLQDLIILRETEGGKENEVEDLHELFNKLQKVKRHPYQSS